MGRSPTNIRKIVSMIISILCLGPALYINNSLEREITNLVGYFFSKGNEGSSICACDAFYFFKVYTSFVDLTFCL